MNPNGYEARVLGKGLYMAIARRHNLTTKKWTRGRLKEFKQEVQYFIKNKAVL